MNQSKLGSIIEVAMNIIIGFKINWICNLWILPLYGFNITGGQAFSMGLIFTIISIVRGYVLRRFFNGYLHLVSKRLAALSNEKLTKGINNEG